MRQLHRTLLVSVALIVAYHGSYAQADGMVAYVPNRPLERTADDARIGFVESAVAGKAEAILPEGAYKADILNVHGNVKHTYSTDELGSLSIGDLRPGTWTLRVHTPDGIRVRRFVVMGHGKVIWSPTASVQVQKRRR